MLNSFDNDNNEGAAFVIETGEAAAGVIVRQANGYRFFATDHQFNLLDGSVSNPRMPRSGLLN